MITKDEIEKWKKESLITAKEMKPFNAKILKKLEKIPIKISKKRMEPDIYYGIFDVVKGKPMIFIWAKTPLRFLPFQEILLQSAMDHELLGHCGNWMAGKDSSEVGACVTQWEIARYRGKKSIVWKFLAFMLPLIQRIHRGVRIEEYNSKIVK